MRSCPVRCSITGCPQAHPSLPSPNSAAARIGPALGPPTPAAPLHPAAPRPAAQFPFSSPRRGGGTWLCPEAVGEPLRCPVTPLPLPALCVTAGRRRRRAADARSRAGGCRGCGVYLSAWLPGKNKKIKNKNKKRKETTKKTTKQKQENEIRAPPKNKSDFFPFPEIKRNGKQRQSGAAPSGATTPRPCPALPGGTRPLPEGTWDE